MPGKKSVYNIKGVDGVVRSFLCVERAADRVLIPIYIAKTIAQGARDAGRAFRHSEHISLTHSTTINHRIRTNSITNGVVLSFSLTATADVEALLYQGGASGGTLETDIIKMSGLLSNEPDLQLYLNPTVNLTGAILMDSVAGKTSPDTTAGEREFILIPGHDYLLQIKTKTMPAIVAFGIHWIEINLE